MRNPSITPSPCPHPRFPRGAGRSPRAGFTLIEVIIAGALLGTVLLMTGMAMQATLLGAQSTTVHASLDNNAAAIIDLMAKELKDGGTKYSNFNISTSQQSITFARSTGCADGKPVFGNQITYAFAKYGNANCLERTEVIGGVARKQILTDKLAPTAVPVTTASGVVVNVTGVNFQMLAADTVTMTIVVQQGVSLLTENTTILDNTMVLSAQASVQLLND